MYIRPILQRISDRTKLLYRYIGRLQFYFRLSLMIENVATRNGGEIYFSQDQSMKNKRTIAFRHRWSPSAFFFFFLTGIVNSPASENRIQSSLCFMYEEINLYICLYISTIFIYLFIYPLYLYICLYIYYMYVYRCYRKIVRMMRAITINDYF